MYLRHSAQESLIAPLLRFLGSPGDLLMPFSVPLKDASGEDMVDWKKMADGGREREDGKRHCGAQAATEPRSPPPQ